MSTPWTITNRHELEILGDTHTPEQSSPIACVLLLHGFKGYKDYGFIPVLAQELCENGMLVHRFNFSTSGMTNDTATFARPDLFERDTWNRQVDDVLRVIDAIVNGEIAGKGLPLFLIGHSRGGATALLTAGRGHNELDLAGVVTLESVDRCDRISDADLASMHDRGYAITTSARTRQDLKMGRDWIDEQRREPEAHDVLLQASRIACPVCVVHGDDDQSVDISAAESIARACSARVHHLEGGNHVLNMPNPSDPRAPGSVQLLEAAGLITRFIEEQGV